MSPNIRRVVARFGAALAFGAPLAVLAADHGVLFRFESGLSPKQMGAQTRHAVSVSRAHASNAIGPGLGIEVPMPDGRSRHFEYRHHEAAIDGNWTWFGRSDEGLDTVLTFGERAVFGRIDRGDREALQLTTDHGRVWLVETDPARQAPDQTLRLDDDVQIPPRHGEREVTAWTALESQAETSAKGTALVDVVIGFTAGLATKYGGPSEATTRLVNLVALSNAGLGNSLVNSRLRLVHALQVYYTDDNSNLQSLEALTGVSCNPTCTPQTVPAALLPLRSARDTYGGDLVALVRPNRAPQQQNCGRAWLLGGGGFSIDNSDSPYAYAVVSDGVDLNENSGFSELCNDHALAHELGHTLGQQHNVNDSGGNSGTHAYSYGYREASSTGFYTIMAYRLANSSQFSITHFGSPNVSYSGRPTGTAGADNARSLNLTMPLVAQFRASVVSEIDLFADGFETPP
jgi:hypothetical protein